MSVKASNLDHPLKFTCEVNHKAGGKSDIRILDEAGQSVAEYRDVDHSSSGKGRIRVLAASDSFERDVWWLIYNIY